ncbi:WD40-repeat-containing domain protein [Cyathus striatus]|nr:WD40-repeat-containing domain protein [Cyathus striatus]
MSTETSAAEFTWTPPIYDLKKPPSVARHLNLVPDAQSPENFPRIAKWSPDGSVLLAQCENASYQFFSTQQPLTMQTEATASGRALSQPAPIVDFAWYPSATPNDPASFCFVSSVRERPVQLLDASDGRLRASYKIVDHRERQIAPHSLSFNLTADKLYCGFEDAVEVFDITRPGEGTRLPTTPSKKSKDGLKGIVSALSFSPSYGADNFYAAGTLTPSDSNIAIFSELQGSEPVMFIGGGPRAAVTQLRFNPVQPHILYASFRRNGVIYGWDLRSNVEEPLSVLSCTATPKTNQKMWFDVDLGGQCLAVGDQDGGVTVFDLVAGNRGESQAATQFQQRQDMVDEVSPKLEFKAHGDSVGSVGFHPIESALFTASGSRHFISGESMNYSSEDEVSEDESSLLSFITRPRKKPSPISLDSSIKIWDLKAEQAAPEVMQVN